MVEPIERYQGMLIMLSEDGYYWESDEWGSESDEFFATAEECRKNIDAFRAGIEDEPGDGMTDAEADADVLRMAGMGTDEDYGGDGEDRL